MKKTIILLPMLMILIVGLVQGATLVDSENFEDYSIGGAWDTLITQSNGKWNCTTGYTDEDYCVQEAGSGSATPSAFTILSTGGSKVLYFDTFSPSNVNYDKIGLTWNHTDLENWTTPRTNYTIKYRIAVGDPNENVTGQGANSNKRLYWSSQLVQQHDFDWWKGGDGYVTSEIAVNYGCVGNFTDDAWHTITEHIYPTEGAFTFTRDVFFDGVPCTEAGSSGSSASFFPLVDLDIRVEKSSIVWLDDIELWSGIRGANETLSTNCTDTTCLTWENPYILRENFCGRLNECNWTTSLDLNFYTGLLNRDAIEGVYSAGKYTDELTSEDSRFFTVSFDIDVENINSTGYFGISLYDNEEQLFVNLFIKNNTLYNNDDGLGVEIPANLSIDGLNEINIHVDFDNDDYDLWFEHEKISSSLQFADSFLNIDSMNSVILASFQADYELDNLYIYSSNENNEITLSDIELTEIINENRSFCNLFFENYDVNCTSDSDCLTSSCMPNGKCNTFDFTYCDENNHKRGNYCMVAGITSCTLESTSNLIIDNFLYFLILILILILIIYLKYSFR